MDCALLIETQERYRKEALSYAKWRNYIPEFVNFTLNEDFRVPARFNVYNRKICTNRLQVFDYDKS